LVDKITANPGVFGCEPIALDADHVEICKPASRNAHLYESVSAFIRRTTEVCAGKVTDGKCMEAPLGESIDSMEIKGREIHAMNNFFSNLHLNDKEDNKTFLRVEEQIDKSLDKIKNSNNTVEEKQYSRHTTDSQSGYVPQYPSKFFFNHPPHNPLPQCAELTIDSTQGSTPTSFDLLPELRFGRGELLTEGLSISYGIIEANLHASLEMCRISSHERLGDNKNNTPFIAAMGGNNWAIKGPREDGILLRRALGAEALCRIEASIVGIASVTLELSCRQRHIDFLIVDQEPSEMPINKKRVLEIFLSKCLGFEEGAAVVSSAKLSIKGQ
jgi:hypothetical protein